VRGFGAALLCEMLKARRSRVPLATAVGFALAPLTGGVFMLVERDPDLARSLGIVSAKAQMFGGSADWATYLAFVAQAVAVGGLFVFALATAWVFGREFSDRTVNNLLAVSTSRAAVVAAKLSLVAVWSTALVAWILGVALLVGWLLGLAGWSPTALVEAAVVLAVTDGMMIALMSPIAFMASVGRGYLVPLGAALLTVFLAQVAAALGWGAWFPWSVPAVYSGLGGPARSLEAGSLVAVLLTGIAGAVATFAWWERADQRT